MRLLLLNLWLRAVLRGIQFDRPFYLVGETKLKNIIFARLALLKNQRTCYCILLNGCLFL
jgi:hypothetical protein